MKVFLSCSGKLSFEVGKELNEMLPCILQSVELFVASEDIELGDFWNKAIEDALDEADCMIICLTKNNIFSPWVSYEAGMFRAKSKKIIPLLIDVSYEEFMKTPLNFLRAIEITEDDMYTLMMLLNEISDVSVKLNILEKSFQCMWGKIYKDLQEIIMEHHKEIL